MSSENILQLNQCFSCKQDFFPNFIQTLSCSHKLCFKCLPITLIKSEFKEIKFDTVSCPCFCNKGKITMKIEEFIENCTEVHDSQLSEEKDSKMDPKNSIAKCQTHKKKIEFYCEECQVEQCRDCINEDEEHDNKRIKIEVIAGEKQKLINDLHQIQTEGDLRQILGDKENVHRETLQNEYIDRKNKIETTISSLKESLVKLKEQYERETKISHNLFALLNIAYQRFLSIISSEQNSISLYENILNIKKEIDSISISTTPSNEIDLIMRNLTKVNPKLLVPCEFQFKECQIKEKNIIIPSQHKDFMSLFFQLNDKIYISGALDKEIHVYNTVEKTLELKQILNGHDGGIQCGVVLNNDGRFATGSYDSNIIIWNLAKAGENPEDVIEAKLQGHTSCVRSLAYISYLGQLNKERLLSCGDDGNVILWDLLTFEEEQKYSDATSGGFHNIIGLYNGIVTVVGHNNGSLSVFNGRTLQKVKTFEREDNNKEQGILCMLEINGRKLAVGNKENNIKIYNPEKKFQIECILEGHTNWVSCLMETKEGCLVSGGRDEMIKVWDLVKKSCFLTLRGHFNTIVGLCLSNANNLLVSGGADGLIKIWNADINPKKE